LKVLDLFSGIGGFSLGLERAGMQTVAFCEIDPYCRAVLRKHWPEVPIHEDIRALRGDQIGNIDIICGGFPCQDISKAGKRAGIEGERSGLWSEYFRLIGELRPSYVIVENVAALLVRGMGRVLGDLASIGYDAEWHNIPAAAVGAPHIRERIWILAYPGQEYGGLEGRSDACSGRPYVLPEGNEWQAPERREDRELVEMVPGVHPGMAADWWRSQSRMDRTANGVPHWMDRCGALGNAVIPQIPEYIGRFVMSAAASAARLSPTE
jgi:DNA (cytosine-5)-methyltransferase 1